MDVFKKNTNTDDRFLVLDVNKTLAAWNKLKIRFFSCHLTFIFE